MRAQVFALAVLSSTLLASCAGGGGEQAPTIIDGEKVERAIERSSLAQRGQHVVVSCPSGVYQQKGRKFTCEATSSRGPIADRVTTRFDVVQLDDAGQVRYRAQG
jgi:hypothetical protein